MAAHYTTKAFKSGNSVAIRIPKALGLREGEEVVLTAHRDGSFSFWRSSDAKRVFMSLYGAFSSGFMADGRGEIDQEERDGSKSSETEAA